MLYKYVIGFAYGTVEGMVLLVPFLYLNGLRAIGRSNNVAFQGIVW